MSSRSNSTLICREIVRDESQNIQLSKRTLDSLKLDRRYQEGKKKEITGNAEINCLMVVCLCITFSIAGMGQGKGGREQFLHL